MTVDVVVFQKSHAEYFLSREEQRKEVFPEGEMEAVTVRVDGIPAAILGWYFVCPGVAQVWSFVSDEAKKAPIAFHKRVKELLEFVLATYEVQRIQISVRVGFKQGWKWASSLGFKCEGIMKHYGPDRSDYWLFARVQ